jgi:hypothetical protein
MEDHEANILFPGMEESLDYLSGVLESDWQYTGYYGIFPAETASRVPP